VTTAEACSKIREPKVAATVQSHLDSALTFYKDRGAWPLVAALKLKAARFHASALFTPMCCLHPVMHVSFRLLSVVLRRLKHHVCCTELNDSSKLS
jgi:hypothetical protein